MNLSSELEQAIHVIQAGDREKGRQLLTTLIKKEPRNEQAWLWLASAVESADQRRYCLKQVLDINPDNMWARKQLETDASISMPPPIEKVPAETEPPPPAAAVVDIDISPVAKAKQTSTIVEPLPDLEPEPSKGLEANKVKSEAVVPGSNSSVDQNLMSVESRLSQLESKLDRQVILLTQLVELQKQQGESVKKIKNEVTGVGCGSLFILLALILIFLVFNDYLNVITKLLPQMKLY